MRDTIRHNYTLTLISAMIRLLIVVVAIASCQIMHGKNDYEVKMPEMITRNYDFMSEISSLLRNTDHKITNANANITISKDCSYDFTVYDLEANSRSGYNWNIDFTPEGSYTLTFTYRIWDFGVGGTGRCMFYIDGLRFTTMNYLSQFFIGCKRTMGVCTFPYCGLFSDRFWFFEVRKGKVVNAFYYYEENDLDLDNLLVYDLINKRFFRYGDWTKRYPYFH